MRCEKCDGTGQGYSSECKPCSGTGQITPPKGLRDEFAMIALSVILKEGLNDVLEPSEIASDSYKIADAMMKEREKCH